jgi:hypothetical protein
MSTPKTQADHDRASLDCRAFAAVLGAMLASTLLVCGASIGGAQTPAPIVMAPSHQACACL